MINKAVTRSLIRHFTTPTLPVIAGQPTKFVTANEFADNSIKYNKLWVRFKGPDILEGASNGVTISVHVVIFMMLHQNANIYAHSELRDLLKPLFDKVPIYDDGNNLLFCLQSSRMREREPVKSEEYGQMDESHKMTVSSISGRLYYAGEL